MGNNQDTITALLINLKSKFQLKHLGSITQLLGIQMTINYSYWSSLHQMHYACDMIHRDRMLECKDVTNQSSSKDFYLDSNTAFSDPTLY